MVFKVILDEKIQSNVHVKKLTSSQNYIFKSLFPVKFELVVMLMRLKINALKV